MYTMFCTYRDDQGINCSLSNLIGVGWNTSLFLEGSAMGTVAKNTGSDCNCWEELVMDLSHTVRVFVCLTSTSEVHPRPEALKGRSVPKSVWFLTLKCLLKKNCLTHAGGALLVLFVSMICSYLVSTHWFLGFMNAFLFFFALTKIRKQKHLVFTVHKCIAQCKGKLVLNLGNIKKSWISYNQI